MNVKLVGRARAVSRKTPIYFIDIKKITNITNIHSHTQTLTYTDTLRHTNKSWHNWESWCSVAWGKKFGHRRSETDKSCPVRMCNQRINTNIANITNIHLHTQTLTYADTPRDG